MIKDRIRVGIDARLLHFPGVGRYIRCLTKGLSVHCPSEVELVIYVDAEYRWTLPSDLQIKQVCAPPFSIKEQVFWPRYIAEDRLDIFHAPHYVFPLFSPSRLIVTLHDLVYFHYPPQGAEATPLRLYYWFMNRAAVVRANAVITASVYSRGDILRHLQAKAEKIFVVPNAVEPHFRPQPEEYCQTIRRQYTLPDAFVLYIGTNKPWKNLKTLLAALAQVVQVRPDCKLVIAGKRGRREDDLTGLIQRFGLDDHIVQVGQIPEEFLPALYSAARIVVCPSLHEGFGLTALEAMACGASLICSNAASLPEVVDGAAIMLDPLNQQAWIETLIELWDNPVLRAALREQGLSRAREFSLERLADETVSVYRHVLHHL